MNRKATTGVRIFTVFNILFLTASSLMCVLPFVNLLAVSFSSSAPAAAGKVSFWPVEFTTSAYQYIMKNDAFLRSFLIALERVAVGVLVNIFMIVITAYPLSKSKAQFRQRNLYSWFFVFTMLFGPSLIPSYIVIQQLGLLDTLWVLILPGALPVFNMIVMLNFFRNLPGALEEAAIIDGAGHFRVLWQIFIPLSKPSIATITLFCIVGHWNSWFDGLIYMNRPENYPLQSYLQTVIVNPQVLLQNGGSNMETAKLLAEISNQTAKAAQLFIATVPVLIAYPFLQKHFTAGLVLGSVKE